MMTFSLCEWGKPCTDWIRRNTIQKLQRSCGCMSRTEMGIL